MVTAVDTHIVLVPTPGGPVPTPLPHPFSGPLDGGLIGSVKIGGQAAAVVGSTASNNPPHIPTPPGTSFQKPPANKGTVFMGSATVKIGGQAAARSGDTVTHLQRPRGRAGRPDRGRRHGQDRLAMSDSMGIDLMVVPGFVAHDAASVDLVPRVRRHPGVAPRGEPDPVDAATIAGRENLAQALILRLLTPAGSLATLGHASYGSQLHRLIGRRKTPELRNLCRAFVLEAVAQEPRVDGPAVTLDFDPAAEALDSFVFTLGCGRWAAPVRWGCRWRSDYDLHPPHLRGHRPRRAHHADWRDNRREPGGAGR